MLGTMLDVRHKIYHFNSPNNPITLVLSSFYTPEGKKAHIACDFYKDTTVLQSRHWFNFMYIWVQSQEEITKDPKMIQ